ncbi:MAG: hypothetical protein ACT4PU_04015 [Planctomycetota bacterium]
MDDHEALVVLAALGARLEGSGALSGAELARRAGVDSAGRLQALARLLPTGRLLARGLLLPDATPHDAPEALSATFRLSDTLFRAACEVFAPEQAPPAGPTLATAYGTNAEVLSDLRRLSLIFRRRAARLFQLDPWSGTGAMSDDALPELVSRAREASARVLERLRLTPAESPPPLVGFAREHSLDVDALVILATLLFQELLEGVGAVDAVDLVRLVSESEGDLLRRRGVLRPLQRRKLVRLEGAYAGKDLTADASLPNEVVERMLGTPTPIGPDDRIDFHAYLEKLRSSETFLADLDSGAFDSE